MTHDDTTAAPDRLAVIDRLAPPPPSEPDVERLLARTRRLIDDDAPAPRRHRRRVVAGGVVALLVAGGGVATAAVVHDHQHLTDAVVESTRGGPDGTPTATPEPSTLHRVIAVPGPDGRDYEAWVERTREGGFCLVDLYAEPGDPNPPVTNGTTCSFDQTDRRLFGEGTAGTEYRGPEPGLTFVYNAPGVARAELRLSDGRTLPVVVRGGWLAGWYPATSVPCSVTATVVARATSGRVLGSFEVQTAGC